MCSSFCLRLRWLALRARCLALGAAGCAAVVAADQPHGQVGVALAEVLGLQAPAGAVPVGDPHSHRHDGPADLVGVRHRVAGLGQSIDDLVEEPLLTSAKRSDLRKTLPLEAAK